MNAVTRLNSKAITTPQAVANYFFKKATEDRRVLTQLQILKLVYIAYGWTIATLGRPLFDEQIEAWKHGPVIPSLYHEFKYFGSQPIGRPAVNVSITGEVSVPEIPKEPALLMVLDKVWEVYRGLSGSQLVELTHQPGTPWAKVYNEYARHIPIEDKDIKEHYQKLIREGSVGGRRSN